MIPNSLPKIPFAKAFTLEVIDLAHEFGRDTIQIVVPGNLHRYVIAHFHKVLRSEASWYIQTFERVDNYKIPFYFCIKQAKQRRQ